MANNKIQIKRTSVSGRAANTVTLTNPGELALNMTDGIMYSTNGSVVFEIGANLTNASVTNILTVKAVSANGSNGTSGQVLTSNGTGSYWSTASGGGTGNASITVSNTAPSSPSAKDLWWNSDLGAMFIYYSDANTSQWVETNPLGQFGVTSVTQVGMTTGKAIAMAIVFGG
jgi:hypothetical protein